MCRYGFIRTCSFVQSEVLGATWSDRTLMFGRVAALLGIKESTLFSKNIVVHLFVFIYPFCYNTPFFFFFTYPSSNEVSAIHTTFYHSTRIKSCSSCQTLHWLFLQEPSSSYKIITYAQSSHQSLGGDVGEPRFFKNKCTFGKILSLELLVSSATGLVQLKQQMMIRCQNHCWGSVSFH